MVKTIMLQGVASNVGKSLLAAGFCRIFHQDGWVTAPFKAWNMALNSYVTRDGREMGRAQATQARACNLEPQALMNPLLLKPDSVKGAQLILNGRPYGYISAGDGYAAYDLMRKTVRESFFELASRFEVIVLEGAGSPAEINLKSHDIANMFTAEMADAPVIIVGDIDRGGVYAHLAGTFDLLESTEQSRVYGFLINKFRGDFSQLAPANDFLEQRTGRKVLGVIPYIPDLLLPAEDSVDFRRQSHSSACVFSPETINIALVDLPHISNFTDFDALMTEPDVRLASTQNPSDLMTADIIFLPGSKNTIHDLHWLWERGFASILARCADKGKIIIGVCAGYQMLGNHISDPGCVESDAGSVDGFQLLDMTTVMDVHKRLTNVNAICLENGAMVTGYEIHHGRSVCREVPFIEGPGGEILGCRNRRGNVWGTYLHGVFDDAAFRAYILDDIRIRKGLPAPTPRIVPTLDQELDRLADVIRRHVDLTAIYQIMERHGSPKG